MKLRNHLLARTSIAALALGFDTGKPGWKMDGDKIAVDDNGDPIYVDAQGREAAIKHDSIAQRNAEAKSHRERAEKAEADLEKFKVDGKLIDPEAAKKAVDTISKIDAKKLIDAGEVDKVRDEIRGEFTTQLTEAQQQIAERDKRIEGMQIDGVFKGSEFITERVAMPRDFFEAAMRSHFKVEDGKVVAYDKAGNRVMSKKSVGEYADPNEALEILVEHHPQKATILKAPAAGGTGSGGQGGNRSVNGRTMKRSEFDALAPQDKAALGPAMMKNELQLVEG